MNIGVVGNKGFSEVGLLYSSYAGHAQGSALTFLGAVAAGVRLVSMKVS